MAMLRTIPLLLLIFLGASCDSQGPTNKSPHHVSSLKQIATAGTSVDINRLGQVDSMMVAINGEVKGFGGMYLDEEDKLVVYIVESYLPHDSVASILPLLRSTGLYEEDVFQIENTTVEPAEFEFESLVVWKRALHELLARPGVWGVDADESRNRVVLNVDPDSEQNDLEEAIRSYGVPIEAIVLFEAGPPVTG